MGLLDQQLVDDGMIFIDLDNFGEAVTYKPVGESNAAINVVVHRLGAEESVIGSGGIARAMEVLMRNHATKGRTSVTPGQDKINVAADKGGSAADHIVTHVLQQDSGGFRLRLS